MATLNGPKLPSGGTYIPLHEGESRIRDSSSTSTDADVLAILLRVDSYLWARWFLKTVSKGAHLESQDTIPPGSALTTLPVCNESTSLSAPSERAFSLAVAVNNSGPLTRSYIMVYLLFLVICMEPY
ncbi:uncharacterized protein LOC121860034 [Homarus americanus]|uniref:uncharacterized protein LOC121860034 n=1 Tax=Homarus americanus TaxID=6706 RepID=UPI001C46B45E|nr:uncharacterized protein LOC121860034 [Homarus americanus]